MKHEIRVLDEPATTKRLSHIPQPPRTLYIRGALPPAGHKKIVIVGSRRCSQYAKQVTEEICRALKGQDVSIISGLALGIDARAHEAAIANGLHTIAVVGSGLDDAVLYPRGNFRLAQKILNSGGAIISEYEAGMRAQKWTFPARNRVMVGLADLVIIIEARAKSGTLITARLATDYNRDVLVVPANIYSDHAKGSNDLIRQGAYVYTRPKDLFDLLGFEFQEQDSPVSSYILNDPERRVLEAIRAGHTQTQQIIERCADSLSVSQIAQILLSLEIENVICRIDGRYVLP